MPAKSEKQRRLMSAARAYKRGEYKGEPSDEIKRLAESMSDEDLTDFMKKEALLKLALSRKENRGMLADKIRRTPDEAKNPADFQVMDADESVDRIPGSSIEKAADDKDKPQGDKMWQGAGIGAALGGSAGAALVALLQGDPDWKDLLTGTGIGAGMGGIVGAGIGINKKAGIEGEIAEQAVKRGGDIWTWLSNKALRGLDSKTADRYISPITSIGGGGGAGYAHLKATEQRDKEGNIVKRPWHGYIGPALTTVGAGWTLRPRYAADVIKGVKKAEGGGQWPALREAGTTLGFTGMGAAVDIAPKIANAISNVEETTEALKVEKDSMTVSEAMKEVKGLINKAKGLDEEGNPIIDPETNKPVKSITTKAGELITVLKDKAENFGKPPVDAEGNPIIDPATGKPVKGPLQKLEEAAEQTGSAMSALQEKLDPKSPWWQENKGKLIAAGLGTAGVVALYKWWQWKKDKEAQKEAAAVMGEEIGEELRKQAALDEMTPEQYAAVYDACLPQMAEFIKKVAACGRRHKKRRKVREKAAKGYKKNIQKTAEFPSYERVVRRTPKGQTPMTREQYEAKKVEIRNRMGEEAFNKKYGSNSNIRPGSDLEHVESELDKGIKAFRNRALTGAGIGAVGGGAVGAGLTSLLAKDPSTLQYIIGGGLGALAGAGVGTYAALNKKAAAGKKDELFDVASDAMRNEFLTIAAAQYGLDDAQQQDLLDKMRQHKIMYFTEDDKPVYEGQTYNEVHHPELVKTAKQRIDEAVFRLATGITHEETA